MVESRTRQASKWSAQVPGRQEVTIRGLRIKVRPDYWLRRLTHFPFFFESHNSSFLAEATKVAEPDPKDPWPNGKLTIEIVFADDTAAPRRFDIPTEWKIGEKKPFPIPNIYVATPGQTILRIPKEKDPSGKTVRWDTLYAYKVRTEESLWLAVLIPAVSLFIAGVTIFGQYITRDDIDNHYPPPATATPSQPIPGTATPPP